VKNIRKFKCFKRSHLNPQKIIVIVNSEYLETHDNHAPFSFWERFWRLFLFHAKLAKVQRRKGENLSIPNNKPQTTNNKQQTIPPM
jgi:hypothetical protein